MFTDKTFCTLPWSHIQINTSGNFKVCCFTGDPAQPEGSTAREHGVGKDENGVVMNVMTHSLEEAMNSTIHKELRLYQSEDKRHPVCRMCWDKEDAGVESHRQKMNTMHDQDDGYILRRHASSRMSSDGTINNFPVFLDIRFGNLCNAKCIMCEPLYSSLWFEDTKEIYGTDEFHVGADTYKVYQENGVYKSNLPKWWESEQFWKDFEKIAPRISELYITGGEPMLVPKHADMLDMLIATGHSKKIKLSYDTNLLAINEKVVNKFQHFRDVVIAVSSDDIEDRFQYIRYPSNWKKLQNNIQLLQKYNVKIKSISLCVGIYSLYSLMRMVPYYNSLGFYDFRQRILNSPVMFDMKWLPRQAKLDAINAYENSNIGQKNWQMTVGYLYNNLDVPENPQMLHRFVERMDKFDKLRKLDWKNTFPEIADIMKNYIK